MPADAFDRMYKEAHERDRGVIEVARGIHAAGRESRLPGDLLRFEHKVDMVRLARGLEAAGARFHGFAAGAAAGKLAAKNARRAAAGLPPLDPDEDDGDVSFTFLAIKIS